jgi:hypothetical protein
MSQADADQSRASLPLRADPASGALIATFLVAACLAGPVGLGLALVVWIVAEAHRRGQRRGEGPPTQGEPTGIEFAARFQELENDILGDDQPGGSA